MKWIQHAIYDVKGTPKPQPRPRAARAGAFLRIYNPGTADSWRTAVYYAQKKQTHATTLLGPVKLGVTFYLPAPKSHAGQDGLHGGKPDLDNLIKSTMDALTQAKAWEDDRQVAVIMASKEYAGPHGPGAIIRIWKLQH